MMSDVKRLIGFEYKPWSFEVEKGKIKEFVQAIGDDNPIYYDIEAAKKEGFQGIPIPLTFLQVVDNWGGYSFQERMEMLQLNPVKILHGGQEFQHHKEIYAGDVLTSISRIIDVVTKTGSTGEMDFITTEIMYYNQHGEFVATSKNVLIQRH